MAELTWYISAKPIADDSSSSGGGLSGGGSATPSQESTNKNQNKSFARSSAQILAVTSAKRSISYLTSNVGKYSGNHRNQTVMNNVEKAIGYGMAFAVNPLLGATTMAFDAITTAIDYSFERKWDVARSQQAKARAGEGVGYRK